MRLVGLIHYQDVTQSFQILGWMRNKTGKGEHHPARLNETTIEDALAGLRFGRYFWVIHVTPARMSIEGRRVGRVEW